MTPGGNQRFQEASAISLSSQFCHVMWPVLAMVALLSSPNNFPDSERWTCQLCLGPVDATARFNGV